MRICEEAELLLIKIENFVNNVVSETPIHLCLVYKEHNERLMEAHLMITRLKKLLESKEINN